MEKTTCPRIDAIVGEIPFHTLSNQKPRLVLLIILSN